MRLFTTSLMAALGALTACSDSSGVPLGGFPHPADMTSASATDLPDYLIGPLDTLSINVFREPDLTLREAPVSASGKLSMPLLGEINVTGRTSQQVADDIRQQLASRYLRDPRVSVAVVRAANYTFTIDGEVKKPGVYQIPNAQLSLMQAVAMGEGVTELAKLDEILVMRTIDEQRYVARFDLRDIRYGRAADPRLRQGDTIVVGFSRSESLFRDAIAALPGAAGIFVALNQ